MNIVIFLGILSLFVIFFLGRTRIGRKQHKPIYENSVWNMLQKPKNLYPAEAKTPARRPMRGINNGIR